jgi:hypothetical protein
MQRTDVAYMVVVDEPFNVLLFCCHRQHGMATAAAQACSCCT